MHVKTKNSYISRRSALFPTAILEGSVIRMLARKESPDYAKRLNLAVDAYAMDPKGPATELLLKKATAAAANIDRSGIGSLKHAIEVIRENNPGRNCMLDDIAISLEKLVLCLELGTGSDSDLVERIRSGGPDKSSDIFDFKGIIDHHPGHPDFKRWAGQLLPRFLELLEHEDRETREELCKLFGEIAKAYQKHRAFAIGALCKALKDEDEDVSYESVSKLEDVSYIEPDNQGFFLHLSCIADSLQHGSDDVRYYSAQILGNIGSTAALPALINALQDSDDQVKCAVIGAIDRIAEMSQDKLAMEPAIHPLVKLLNYPDYTVIDKAECALRTIAGLLDVKETEESELIEELRSTSAGFFLSKTTFPDFFVTEYFAGDEAGEEIKEINRHIQQCTCSANPFKDQIMYFMLKFEKPSSVEELLITNKGNLSHLVFISPEKTGKRDITGFPYTVAVALVMPQDSADRLLDHLQKDPNSLSRIISELFPQSVLQHKISFSKELKIIRDGELQRQAHVLSGISVPYFGSEDELRRIMYERAKYSATISQEFIQGARTHEDIESNIRSLFSKARELDDDKEFHSCVYALEYAKDCGFISGEASRELFQLSISKLRRELQSGSRNLRGISAAFEKLESNNEEGQELKQTFHEMLVVALKNTAERAKKAEHWSHVGLDDLDYALGLEDKKIEKYKPADWEEVVAETRQETYSVVLEKEKSKLCVLAKDHPIRVFTIIGEGSITESHFFSDIDKLADKLGIRDSQEIEDYKDSVRREFAEPAFDYCLKEAEEQMHVFESGDQSQSSLKTSDNFTRAGTAARYLGSARKSHDCMAGRNMFKCAKRLNQVESRLAPHVLGAVRENIQKRRFVELGNDRNLQEFLDDWSYWIGKDSDFRDEANALIEQAKNNRDELRRAYKQTRDPRILADIISGLPILDTRLIGREYDETHIVPTTFMSGVTCEQCGAYRTRGTYTIKNPETSESIGIRLIGLHALKDHPETIDGLQEKMKEFERVLCL